MKPKSRRLSIRLLRKDWEPDRAVGDRKGQLESWSRFPGSFILLGAAPEKCPEWAEFLGLSAKDRAKLRNQSSYGLVFLKRKERWFVFSFGYGHALLDSSAVELDFGLRVAINALDAKELRSADLTTPDANSLSRRSQSSRGAEQSIFSIDAERDILLSLAGRPEELDFGAFMSGKDALTISKKVSLDELPGLCDLALEHFAKDVQREEFSWIGQIRDVRAKGLIEELDVLLVGAVNEAMSGEGRSVHLVYPGIYDPERMTAFKYEGLGRQVFHDLSVDDYFGLLRERAVHEFTEQMLQKRIVEVDEDGKPVGGKWRLYSCLSVDVEQEGKRYVLSAGKWYRIDPGLVAEVEDFFERADKSFVLPSAMDGELEADYNKRVSNEIQGAVCLDTKLSRPPGASSGFEVCDIFAPGVFVHVKRGRSAPALSHLFSQGLVSGRVLASEPRVRDELKKLLEDRGCISFLANSSEFRQADFRVVFGVVSSETHLPFFSLMSFRHAARGLELMGYKVGFSWIGVEPAADSIEGELAHLEQASKIG